MNDPGSNLPNPIKTEEDIMIDAVISALVSYGNHKKVLFGRPVHQNPLTSAIYYVDKMGTRKIVPATIKQKAIKQWCEKQ